MPKSLANAALFLSALAFIGYGLFFNSSEETHEEPVVETNREFREGPKRLEPPKTSPTAKTPVEPKASRHNSVQEPKSPEPEVTDSMQPPEWPAGSVEFEIKEGKYAVGFGDIVLGVVPEERRDVKRAYFEPPASRLWPSPQIPFTIEEGTPNTAQIQAAIDYFHQETPIRFVPFQGEEDSVVFIAAEKICASQLGRVGGHQVILVSPECQRNEIIHEIMHTLGFVHEHSREDRDRFVEVLWENIQPEYYLQFQKVPDVWVNEYRGSVFDFDPKSIMLYPPTAFAKSPGAQTLRSKGRLALEPSLNGLSRMDKERVYYLYGH